MSGAHPIEFPSPNREQRPAGTVIDCLVVHYTGMQSAEAALARLTDGTAKVSAHYCVGEDGTVWRLVDERMRAWHAGVAQWRGRGDLNSRSIGIELVNPGHEWGYRASPAAQMGALIVLARAILARHPAIEARNIVGHSDIAPTRKTDPGELFEWPKLAQAGIGLWPEDLDRARPRRADRSRATALLAAIGYDCTDLAATLTAFQRRFRPRRCDGALDEETMARLVVMARCYGGG